VDLGLGRGGARARTCSRSRRTHSTVRSATTWTTGLREHLTEIQAERVVLTHMSTSMLARLTDAELPAAYDGMSIDV
jgi:phosphoribosyl 1,2-cyclic phosphodiesterase